MQLVTAIAGVVESEYNAEIAAAAEADEMEEEELEWEGRLDRTRDTNMDLEE